jgi:hypothetical protein
MGRVIFILSLAVVFGIYGHATAESTRGHAVMRANVVMQTPDSMSIDVLYENIGPHANKARMRAVVAYGNKNVWDTTVPEVSVPYGKGKLRMAISRKSTGGAPFRTDSVIIQMYSGPRVLSAKVMPFSKVWRANSNNHSSHETHRQATANAISEAWIIAIAGERQSHREVTYLKLGSGSSIQRATMFRRSLSGVKELASGTFKDGRNRGYLELVSKRGSILECRLDKEKKFIMTGNCQRKRRNGENESRVFQFRYCKEISYDNGRWRCQ